MLVLMIVYSHIPVATYGAAAKVELPNREQKGAMSMRAKLSTFDGSTVIMAHALISISSVDAGGA
jgi:hypothetical protein